MKTRSLINKYHGDSLCQGLMGIAAGQATVIPLQLERRTICSSTERYENLINSGKIELRRIPPPTFLNCLMLRF